MRSAPNISAEARDFLERMLKPEASDRATLRELLEHEWLQDGGVPDDELYAVMDDKKRRVDAAKSEERVKERARQKAAKAQGQQFDPFREQHKVRRGVATNDESVDGLPKAGVAGKAVHTRLYLPEEFGAGKQGDRVARILSQLQSSLTDLGCTDIALFDPMPVIHLLPADVKEYKPSGCYSCPLYKTSIRAGTLSTTGHSTNFVVALDIPTDKEINADTQVCDHWVKRGTAMLCMLDT